MRKALLGLIIAPAILIPASTAAGQDDNEECDPNYEGACVPVAEDVDCAGGTGDGPEFVEGPVQVIGDDVYDLDADGDGVGCEADAAPMGAQPEPSADPVTAEPDFTG